MQDKTLYSIGEIASICRISTHKLRHYEKKSIISPDYIDEDTGWRFYSKEQILFIDVIKELREQNFSLSEIKHILNLENVDQISHIYKLKEEKLQSEIDALIKAKKLIEHRIEHFNNVKPDNPPDKPLLVTLKHISERSILYLEKKEKISPEMFVRTHNEMRNIIEEYNVKVSSPCMVIYYDDYEKCTEIESHVDICKELIYEHPIMNSEYIKILPANLYAIIKFSGAREESLENYLILVDWIKKHSYRIIGPVMKIYHVHGMHTTNTNKFISEIQIPVCKE